MNPFHCGFEATLESHEAKSRQRAENARKLAAFDDLLAAAEEMRDWAMVITLGESPSHPLPKLRAAIKKAGSA